MSVRATTGYDRACSRTKQSSRWSAVELSSQYSCQYTSITCSAATLHGFSFCQSCSRSNPKVTTMSSAGVENPCPASARLSTIPKSHLRQTCTQLLLAADLAESCTARIVWEDSETELGQMTLVENQKKTFITHQGIKLNI